MCSVLSIRFSFYFSLCPGRYTASARRLLDIIIISIARHNITAVTLMEILNMYMYNKRGNGSDLSRCASTIIIGIRNIIYMVRFVVRFIYYTYRYLYIRAILRVTTKVVWPLQFASAATATTCQVLPPPCTIHIIICARIRAGRWSENETSLGRRETILYTYVALFDPVRLNL